MPNPNTSYSKYLTRGKSVETLQFDWGQITWLDSHELNGNDNLTVGLVYIDVGKSNPLHIHPNCDETLTLLDGELEHAISDESFGMLAGDSIHIPQGVPHCAKNTGFIPAKMIVSFNSGHRTTEMVEV